MAFQNPVKRYVLLVRHGSRDRKWELPESDHPLKGWDERFFFGKVLSSGEQKGTASGCEPPANTKRDALAFTRDMAAQLCDQLDTQAIAISHIFHSEHRIARDTASVFGYVFGRRQRGDVQAKEMPMFTPGESLADAQAKTRSAIWLIENSSYQDKDGGPSNAAGNYLIVGHQPQLTYIARNLLDKSLRENNPLRRWGIRLKQCILFNYALPGNVLPIESSEIACIEISDHSRLLWLMTEKTPELMAELKAKIASKFQVATFFLGALVVGTGLTLSDAIWTLTNRNAKLVAGIGAFFALVSLGLTAATLFSYDRLLMPQQFWCTDKVEDRKVGRLRGWFRRMRGAEAAWSVSRPPSQAHVILFYEMVHVWTRLFIPAILSAFLAVALTVAARAHNSLTVPAFYYTWWLMKDHPLITFLVFAFFAFFVGFLAFQRFKPSLGFDD
jgi:phosphohistidine phosphatase SixA